MHLYGGKQGADHHWGGDRAHACMVLRNSRGTPHSFVSDELVTFVGSI